MASARNKRPLAGALGAAVNAVGDALSARDIAERLGELERLLERVG
jgi:hypothetical protein